MVQQFVREVLQGAVTVGPDTEAMINARIAQIDHLLSLQLNEILHHPDFQALEASWRGLAYLVFKTETGTQLKLRLLNANRKELQDDPKQPLYNKALQGLYPPASTWKLLTAAVGLEEKVVSLTDKMPVSCSGGFTYGRYFRCWDKNGHGAVDLSGAIAKSCDRSPGASIHPMPRHSTIVPSSRWSEATCKEHSWITRGRLNCVPILRSRTSIEAEHAGRRATCPVPWRTFPAR